MSQRRGSVWGPPGCPTHSLARLLLHCGLWGGCRALLPQRWLNIHRSSVNGSEQSVQGDEREIERRKETKDGPPCVLRHSRFRFHSNPTLKPHALSVVPASPSFMDKLSCVESVFNTMVAAYLIMTEYAKDIE